MTSDDQNTTIPPYCPVCLDSCIDAEDPTGQADCRFCGGSFAWRQREKHVRAHQAKQEAQP